jgi:hypothetical protein
MPSETELLLNRLGQGVTPVAEGIRWFSNLAPAEQLAALRTLWNFAVQASLLKEDVDVAVVRSGLKSTFTPVVLMLSGGPTKIVAAKVLNLPPAEYAKSFRLFLALFQQADERRRRTACANGCKHWWHQTAGDS